MVNIVTKSEFNTMSFSLDGFPLKEFDSVEIVRDTVPYGSFTLLDAEEIQIKAILNKYVKTQEEVDISVSKTIGEMDTYCIKICFVGTIKIQKGYKTKYNIYGITETTFNFDIIEER